MLAKIVVVSLLAGLARAAEGDDVRLLPLSGLEYRFERIGSLTSVSCAEPAEGDDCRVFDSLHIQPQVDWDRLAAAGRRKAPGKKGASAPVAENAVDRFGGPWKFILRRGAGKDAADSYVVKPDFPGYKVSYEDGKVSEVEVLRDRDQWLEACRDLGVGEDGRKRKKKGFGALFE